MVLVERIEAKNVFLHLIRIFRHKYWVMYYCFYAGLYWQGIVHDLSKFSPTEFWESVRYYNDRVSPVEVRKKKWGYSDSWFHHRGRNKHHYEMWTDNYDRGITTVRMPYEYALEMVCDFLGAGRAYYGKEFTPRKELEYWENKKKDNPDMKIHPDTKSFVDKMLNIFVDEGTPYFLKTDRSYEVYLSCLEHDVVV